MDWGTFNTLMDSIQENPRNWGYPDEERYTIKHVSGFEIWVSNGIVAYKIYRPVEMKFSFLQKWYFHRVYKAWFREVIGETKDLIEHCDKITKKPTGNKIENLKP